MPRPSPYLHRRCTSSRPRRQRPVGPTYFNKMQVVQIAAGPEPVLEWLAATIDSLVVGLGRKKSDVVAVGIGLPGPVEHSSGKPSQPPIMPGWNGFDVPRRDYHNETVGILICGTKNDRSVRYSLGRSTSPMAVAAYTYDKLPEAEQQALPNEGHLVAALEWAEPGP